MSTENPTDIPVEDPRPSDLRRAPSLVVVNTGNGKGKTTAAIGVAVRGHARGWSVGVVQFLKSGTWHTGEEKVCRKLGMDWWAIGEGFTWDSTDLGEDQAVAQRAWAHARQLIAGGNHQLVILDEVTYPLNWGWIDSDDVLASICERPRHVNIVCTGRNAPTGLIEIADTVSEINVVKHAYTQGIRGKRGVDY